MNEVTSGQEKQQSTSMIGTPWLDVLIGISIFSLTFMYAGIGGIDGGPVIKIAMLISLAASFTGPTVFLRRLIHQMPIQSGIWVWGIHGVVGLVCLGILSSLDSFSTDNMGKFGIMIFSVSATMGIQGILALVAAYRLFSAKSPIDGYDRLGILCCIAHAAVIGVWAIFVWH